MAHYNFSKDLIEGELGEGVIIKDLESMGLQFKSNNKDNKYDISMMVPPKHKYPSICKFPTYEIKTDVFCHPSFDTGNMFIEKECRGKPSGIEVTQAQWFVTYYKYFNEAWYIKTKNLKKLIMDNDFPITQNSGDVDSNTKGYLIPRNEYKNIFIVRTINDE